MFKYVWRMRYYHMHLAIQLDAYMFDVLRILRRICWTIVFRMPNTLRVWWCPTIRFIVKVPTDFQENFQMPWDITD